VNWGYAALAGVAAWFLMAKPSRKMVAGSAYRVRFELPAPIANEQLLQILPAGSGIARINERLIDVTFVAPRSSDENPDTPDELADIPTPVGTIKIVSVERL